MLNCKTYVTIVCIVMLKVLFDFDTPKQGLKHLTCGPHRGFVAPVMLFWNFQMIKI